MKNAFIAMILAIIITLYLGLTTWYGIVLYCLILICLDVSDIGKKLGENK